LVSAVSSSMELFIGQASFVNFVSTPTSTALSFLIEVENVIDIS
jgi:hypothetical protein